MANDIEREEVRQLAIEGVPLVEVMPAEDYRGQGHLPGAINIPLQDIDAAIAQRLDPLRPVIVYCYDLQ